MEFPHAQFCKTCVCIFYIIACFVQLKKKSLGILAVNVTRDNYG